MAQWYATARDVGLHVASVVGLHTLRGGHQFLACLALRVCSALTGAGVRVCVRRVSVPGALSPGSGELVQPTQPGRWPRQRRQGGGTRIWMIGATARRWTRCRNCTSRARGEAGLGVMGGEGKRGWESWAAESGQSGCRAAIESRVGWLRQARWWEEPGAGMLARCRWSGVRPNGSQATLKPSCPLAAGVASDAGRRGSAHYSRPCMTISCRQN